MSTETESAERRARFVQKARPHLERLIGIERCEPMPWKFDQLATYNAERYRGIMHTPEWRAKMADLQREYDAWLAARR